MTAPRDPNLTPAQLESLPEPSGAEVDRIRQHVPIEEVVGEYLELRRVGSTFRGDCPFHVGEKPSFVVFPTTQTFHCFGCDAHGGVVSFLMRLEHLTLPEAVQKLQRYASRDAEEEPS
jgi:DNA primase